MWVQVIYWYIIDPEIVENVLDLVIAVTMRRHNEAVRKAHGAIEHNVDAVVFPECQSGHAVAVQQNARQTKGDTHFRVVPVPHQCRQDFLLPFFT